MSGESDIVSDAAWERLAKAIADVRLRARAEGRVSSLEEYGLRLDVSAREWEPGHPPTVIASGPINDLCGDHGGVDQFVTLDVAVDAVRRYLLRAGCEHENSAQSRSPVLRSLRNPNHRTGEVGDHGPRRPLNAEGWTPFADSSTAEIRAALLDDGAPGVRPAVSARSRCCSWNSRGG